MYRKIDLAEHDTNRAERDRGRADSGGGGQPARGSKPGRLTALELGLLLLICVLAVLFSPAFAGASTDIPDGTIGVIGLLKG